MINARLLEEMLDLGCFGMGRVCESAFFSFFM